MPGFGTIAGVGAGLGLLTQTAEESDNWGDTVLVVLYGPWVVMACALLIGLAAGAWALSSGARRRAIATDDEAAAEGSWVPRTHAPQGEPWAPDDAAWDAYQSDRPGEP